MSLSPPNLYARTDCIEAMACSDNTIRAGLTPKYKDIDTLCSSLTYRLAPVEENMFRSVQGTCVRDAYARFDESCYVNPTFTLPHAPRST
jgi:mannose-6-phosphate isomerase class I